MQEKDKNIIKGLLIVLLLILCDVLIFAVWKFGSELVAQYEADSLDRQMQQQATVTESEKDPEALDNSDLAAPTEDERTTPPIDVNVVALQKDYPNLVGWLYCEGLFDFPVMQGSDNSYYLYRLPDGSYNSHGSLFLDAATPADFLSPNNIVYGHNIISGGRFHELPNYEDQGFYEEHPVMYFYTARTIYQVDLFAGYYTSFDQSPEVFAYGYDNWEAAISRSCFDSGLEAPGCPVLTLITCAGLNTDKRFVLHGTLVQICKNEH